LRRIALIAVAATLAYATAAIAVVDPVNLTLEPKGIGEGSVATLDYEAAKSWSNPRGLVVRVKRGFKVGPKAVETRCRVAEAAQTGSCPSGSRIGGGRADLTVTPGGRITADVDLYLAPRQSPGDLAGVVVIANAAGQKRHAVGRVFRLDRDRFRKYGLQATFGDLRKAFKPPPGFKVHVDHINVHVGTHRTVDGERHDLLRNPSSCGASGWPWQVLLIHPGGDRSHLYGAFKCSPSPTP
jgi:hypothetical protein